MKQPTSVRTLIHCYGKHRAIVSEVLNSLLKYKHGCTDTCLNKQQQKAYIPAVTCTFQGKFFYSLSVSLKHRFSVKKLLTIF